MISAISPKAIKVAFSKAVSDEDKAKLNMSVSNTAALTEKWADDKMSVELEKATNFLPGKYTVSVKFEGKEIAKEELEFKAVAPAKIVINSDVIAKGNPVDLDVDVLDQYGKKMNVPAADAVGVVVNKTEPGRKVTQVVGNFKQYDTSAAEINDELEFAIVLKADTSVKATKVVKVGYPVDKDVEILFGEVKMPVDQTEINPGNTFFIPVTVKKGGEEVKPAGAAAAIPNGGDLNAHFAGLDLKLFYNVDSVQQVRYIKADKAFEITLKATAKPGTYDLKLMDSKAVETKVSYSVVAKAAPQVLEIKSLPSAQLSNGKSTSMELKVLMSDGKEATAGDLAGHTVKVTKTNADVTISAPANNATINPANIVAPITITAAAVGQETITFQLMKGTEKVGLPVEVKIEVVAAITHLGVRANKTTYKAGQEIELTIQAEVGAGNPVNYNMSIQQATIEVGNPAKDTYKRDLLFEDGIARVKVPAKVAMPADSIKVTFDGINGSVAGIIIEAAEAKSFKVTKGGAGQITIKALDEFGNVDKSFAGTKTLTVTAKTKDNTVIKLKQVTGDNTIDAEFADGEKANLAVHDADLEAGSVLTVEFEGLTGTLTY